MAKNKDELIKEAEALGVSVNDDMTNAEIEEAIKGAEEENLPSTYERRFNPAERKAQAKKASTPESSEDKSETKGPDASAGVGASNVNTGTAGAGAAGTTRTTR